MPSLISYKDELDKLLAAIAILGELHFEEGADPALVREAVNELVRAGRDLEARLRQRVDVPPWETRPR